MVGVSATTNRETTMTTKTCTVRVAELTAAEVDARSAEPAALAEHLIALSRDENRTVTEYPSSSRAARALLEELGVYAADDCSVAEYVSDGGYYDVWGDDWRVHVVAEAAS